MKRANFRVNERRNEMNVKIIYIKRSSFITVAIAITLIVCSEIFSAMTQPHSYIPKDGFVPDEATAIHIAEAILPPIYGKSVINEERPFHAKLHNGIWMVSGSLSGLQHGGVAVAEISKKSAMILRVSHGR